MEVLQDKDNFLTNRKEIKVVVDSEKNPTYDEAKDIVINEFNADKENVVVKKIKGKFGRDTFLISAFIYKSKEDKEYFEPKSKGNSEGDNAEEGKGEAKESEGKPDAGEKEESKADESKADDEKGKEKEKDAKEDENKEGEKRE